MSSAHEQHGGNTGTQGRALPAIVAAPDVVIAWRMRALIVAAFRA